VFTDLKGKTVTAVGNAQISTAQSKFGGASALFDGTGDYLTCSAPVIPATDDFTIECWIYRAVSGVFHTLLGQGDDGGAALGRLSFTVRDTNKLSIFFASTVNLSLIGATSIALQTWTHVALVRSGSVFRIFINGVLDAEGSSSQAVYTSANSFIARSFNSASPLSFNGHLDDLRVTSGVARYTANFTPPALAFPNGPAMISGTVKDSTNAFAPRAVRVHRKSDGALSGATTSHATTGAFAVPALDATPHYAITHDTDADPYWSNVVLATHFDTDSVIDPYMSSVVLGLHMEGANASTVFQDVTGKTITAAGTAAISTEQAKFGNSSGKFGTSTANKLTATASTGFALGGGAFTIEFWTYPTADNASGGFMLTAGGGVNAWNTTDGWHWAIIRNASGCNLQVWVSGTTGVTSTRVACSLNTWTHIAFTYDGTSIYAFSAGVLIGTTTSATAAPSTTPTLAVGELVGAIAGATNTFTGYLDEIRITKGVARYTATFTPPTVPFSSFKDLTGKDLMVNGVPSISTATKKYGDGALYCGGAAAFLTTSVPVITSIAFTIEFWVRVATATEQAFFSQYSNGDGRLTTALNSVGKLEFFIGATAGNTLITAPATFPTATFTHVAICRTSAGLITMFIDGVQVAQGVNATALASTFNSIGAQVSTTNGVQRVSTSYIDDLRVTNGIARYQTDFTPPERAFTGAMTAGVNNALIFDNLIPE
jgi:hypothetical protein